MAQINKSHTFTFTTSNIPISLIEGDKIEIKLKCNYVSSPNFTASFNGGGSLSINSTSTYTGYNLIDCLNGSFVTTSSLDTLVFNSGISGLYGGDYTFVPNPLSGSATSSLYPIYGDVDYPFVLEPYDALVIQFSDGTFLETRISNVYEESNLIYVTLTQDLSSFARNEIDNDLYLRMLFLKRLKDETNTFLIFSKRPGQTSYGFLIPENLSPDVLNNIDTITRQVKQKLLSDQSSPVIVGDLTGGTFGP